MLKYVILLLILSACTYPTPMPSTPDKLQREIARMRGMIAESYSGVATEEVEPLLPADQLGADYGMGFANPEGQVFISVYIFMDASQKEAAIALLEAAAPANAVRILKSGNGPSYFFGYTTSETRESRFMLSGLASAFAGEE